MSDVVHITDVAMARIIAKVLVDLIMSVVDFELNRPVFIYV
jgi:hypothetical protein